MAESDFGLRWDLAKGLNTWEEYCDRAKKLHTQGDMKTLGDFLIVFNSDFAIGREVAFWRDDLIASYDEEDRFMGDYTVQQFYDMLVPSGT